MKKVLLAVGNDKYSNILRNAFKKLPEDFTVPLTEVLNIKFLDEVLENEKPDIVIFHDTHLPSATPREERETEWLEVIRELKYKHNNSLRIVFLCERESDDVFLRSLIGYSVLDIFHANNISLHGLLEQLLDEPNYSNVAHIIGNENNISFQGSVDNEPIAAAEEGAEVSKGKKAEPVVVKKVIEKKVVNKIIENKIVQKNVIKKEFQLNFQREVKIRETVGIAIEPKTILIGGAYQRIGSSFISHLLTDYVTSFRIPVTYIENPYRFPYTFDRYFGEEKFSEHTSAFHTEVMKDNAAFIKEMEWLDGDKQLIVLNPLIERPYTLDKLDFESFLKIIFKFKSPINIIDVGNDWNNPVVKDLLDIASDVFLVVDNDPFATQNFFEQRIFPSLFDEGRLMEKVTVIMNKSSDKIVQDEIFEGVYDDILSFPYIAEESIFSHISDRQWLYPLITKEVEEHLLELALYFLPEELLQKQKKKSSLFSLPKFSIKSK